jgi:hypothetical protein
MTSSWFLPEEDAAVLDRRVYEATRNVGDPLARVRRALWAVDEFLDANPLFVDNSVSRMTAGRQRFDCLHEVAADVEADVHKCIARGQLRMALTAAATRQLL